MRLIATNVCASCVFVALFLVSMVIDLMTSSLLTNHFNVLENLLWDCRTIDSTVTLLSMVGPSR